MVIINIHIRSYAMSNDRLIFFDGHVSCNSIIKNTNASGTAIMDVKYMD